MSEYRAWYAYASYVAILCFLFSCDIVVIPLSTISRRHPFTIHSTRCKSLLLMPFKILYFEFVYEPAIIIYSHFAFCIHFHFPFPHFAGIVFYVRIGRIVVSKKERFTTNTDLEHSCSMCFWFLSIQLGGQLHNRYTQCTQVLL